MPSDAGHTSVTLEEVAARAGVSRATVSRVINSSPRVSATARRAVEEAIAELGYIPNRAARTLVTRRTESVALVIAEPEDRLFSDPFFAGIARGVGGVLGEHGLQLVLLMRRSDTEQRRLTHYLSSDHVDGAIIVSLHGDDRLPERLAAQGLPVVVGGRPQPDQAVPFVDVDNVGGAHEAVTHLLERGRRRIATITGPLDMAAAQDRLAGYRAALTDAGVTPDDQLVASGTFEEDSGSAAMRALLERRPDLDAVFAASDLMAAGALQVLAARGRRVPQEVAVVGFDDIYVSRATQPPLTTVRQPIEDMGRALARLLIAALHREEHPLHVALATVLIRRGSS